MYSGAEACRVAGSVKFGISERDADSQPSHPRPYTLRSEVPLYRHGLADALHEAGSVKFGIAERDANQPEPTRTFPGVGAICTFRGLKRLI